MDHSESSIDRELNELIGSLELQPTSKAIREKDIVSLTEDEVKAELDRKENAQRNFNKWFRAFLKQRDEEHELRKLYLYKTFKFVSYVTMVALAMTFMKGVGGMNLSDSVVITLLTTTIANVIGCLLIAFHWLFPKREGLEGCPDVNPKPDK